jgi:V8-like Glu-specific endopeptidase
MPALTKIQEVFDLDGSSWNYQLPQTWKTAKGALDLNTTLSFIADSDTIGGNSGSAVVNTQGELVGLVWGGSEHGSIYYTYEANDRSLIISAISIGSVLRNVYKLDRIAHEISD